MTGAGAVPPLVSLTGGLRIPILGLGMDQVRDPQVAYDCVRHALDLGYRSIDTASSYGNEEPVGRAVRESGVPREDIVVTSKVTAVDQGYDRTLAAFDRSLAHFGLEYLDLYLIHWPGKYLFPETWQALERLQDEGRVRAVGVCNFNAHHIERLRETSDLVPVVDQIEWHPYFQQPELAEYCGSRGIVVEAWSPLMAGGDALADPVVVAVADRVGRTPAQVILRWHVQEGRRVFPRSVTPARIEENFRLFDFALSDEDVAALDGLGSHRLRIGPDPDVFFMV